MTDAVVATRSVAGLVDRWLAAQRWYRQLPSIAVGLSVGDEIVLSAGYGLADLESRQPATAATQYRIASHSKVFTATAIMQLVERGELRLDDSVVDHVDWFRTTPTGVAGSEDQPADLAHVTVRHLLCHASGLTRDGSTTHWHDDRFPSLDAIKAQVGTLGTVGVVEQLKYSNVAYTIAGQVIESVTCRSYEDHVTQSIIEPLGLGATTPKLPDDLGSHATGYSRWLPGRERRPFDQVEAGVMNSATGFSSTVEDLLRWYQAHRYGSGELLADRTKREMQRLQFDSGDTRWGLGFGLTTHAGLSFASHGGGYPGFITFSGIEQEHGIALVVLTNAADGSAGVLFNGVAELLARALKGGFDDEPTFDLELADDLAGFYETRWGISLASRVGSRMVTLDPLPADPAPGMQVLDHVQDWTFRCPDTLPTGSPRELVRFEHGNPPRMIGPATPPIERSDHFLDVPDD